MQHPDEKTLAFYAMGADLPDGGTTLIEDHLRSCAGCREHVEELRSINSVVAGRVSERPTVSPYGIEAIERSARSQHRPHVSPSRRSPRHMVTRVQRAVWFVRSHPVVSGAGTMLLGIALFGLIVQINSIRLRGEQPAYLRADTITATIGVYNADGAELWQFPISRTLPGPTPDPRYSEGLSQIVDLDGDGTMEVITGAPIDEGSTSRESLLRIFSSTGDPVREVSLGTPLTYLGSEYQNTFIINAIVVAKRNGRSDILVCMNNPRSPSCLMRLNSAGEVIGEYWHFGWIRDPQWVRVAGIDHDLILLAGGNDSHYLEGVVSAAFAVLDPDSIIGRRESAVTYGFGFPRSTAEAFYVQADCPPDSLLKAPLPHHMQFDEIRRPHDDGSWTMVASGLAELTDYGLMYTFDPKLAIREVWASDLHRTAFAQQLLKDGSAEGLKAFFACMKSRVRYWDGQQWQPATVRVRHPQPSV